MSLLILFVLLITDREVLKSPIMPVYLFLPLLCYQLANLDKGWSSTLYYSGTCSASLNQMNASLPCKEN